MALSQMGLAAARSVGDLRDELALMQRLNLRDHPSVVIDAVSPERGRVLEIQSVRHGRETETLKLVMQGRRRRIRHLEETMEDVRVGFVKSSQIELPYH